MVHKYIIESMDEEIINQISKLIAEIPPNSDKIESNYK